VTSGDPFVRVETDNLEGSEISMVEHPKNYPIYEVFDLKSYQGNALDETKLMVHSLK
jgi:hypothetical protein